MTRSASFRLEFTVTPRFDVFYALYALTSNAPSVLDPWKEKAIARLPRDFDGSAKQVAPLPIFWPLLADAIQGVPGEVAFEEVLSTIREMRLDDLKRNILSGIFHDRGIVDALVTRKNALKQILTDEKLPGGEGELLAHFGLRPYDAGSPAARAINSLLSQPQSYRDQLCVVLQQFWDTGFRRDWAALEPSLRDESFRMRDLQEEGSSAELARELNLPVTIDDGAKEIRPKSGSAIAYDRIDRCFIVPSAFNTRRLWAKYETAARRVTLYLPITREVDAANEIVEDEGRQQERTTTPAARTAINAESVFRALGDTTRYAIASILARTPTTSAELARSLKVSKPTITHHVHALRSAGLITETPSRGSTKLSLSRDTLAALSGAAVEQLFSTKGDLTLGTTRRRRSS